MLATRESAAAWELRTAWASRRVIVILLDPAVAAFTRLAGWVERVSPTDALAVLETLDGERVDVPCSAVLSLRRPHFTEPEDRPALAAPPREPRVIDPPHADQMAFDFPIEQMELR
jgi:hypothetical protein